MKTQLKLYNHNLVNTQIYQFSDYNLHCFKYECSRRYLFSLTPQITPPNANPFVDVKPNLAPQILDHRENEKVDVSPPSVDNPYGISKNEVPRPAVNHSIDHRLQFSIE